MKKIEIKNFYNLLLWLIVLLWASGMYAGQLSSSSVVSAENWEFKENSLPGIKFLDPSDAFSVQPISEEIVQTFFSGLVGVSVCNFSTEDIICCSPIIGQTDLRRQLKNLIFPFHFFW